MNFFGVSVPWALLAIAVLLKVVLSGEDGPPARWGSWFLDRPEESDDDDC